MKINIVSEEEKKLIGRKEVLLDVNFTGKTPTGSEIHAQVIGLLKAKKDLVVVKNINQIYGSNKAKVLVYVYDSIENLKNCEKETRKSKKAEKKKWLEEKKGGKKMTEEEKPAEEKKEEAPIEEKKEVVEEKEEEEEKKKKEEDGKEKETEGKEADKEQKTE